MAGTQNLENTSQLHQSQQQQQQQQKPEGGDDKNDVGEGEGGGAPVKEDFVRAPPSSQSNDRLNASANDPFDREAAAAEGASPTTASSSDSPPDPIQNMTREAGDGQNDNGTENAE